MFKTLEKKRWLAFVLFILIAIQIFWFSSLPLQGAIEVGKPKLPILSMIYHFCAFFLFAFFLSASLNKKEFTKNNLRVVIIISILYAILDEVHQAFVPGRASTLRDVIIDMIGIFVATFIYVKTSKKLILKKEKSHAQQVKEILLSKKK